MLLVADFISLSIQLSVQHSLASLVAFQFKVSEGLQDSLLPTCLESSFVLLPHNLQRARPYHASQRQYTKWERGLLRGIQQLANCAQWGIIGNTCVQSHCPVVLCMRVWRLPCTRIAVCGLLSNILSPSLSLCLSLAWVSQVQEASNYLSHTVVPLYSLLFA